MGVPDAVDVHQHLWPEQLVDRLRARSRAPYLRGWTLYTKGEPPSAVDPAAHEAEARCRTDEAAGIGLAGVSLSAPLGIEYLVRPEAGVLLDAWHAGATDLPGHYAPWASVPVFDPDLDALEEQLAGGPGGRFVGLQLPATELLSPAAWERAGSLLAVAQASGRPVLVHPGPVINRPLAGDLPGWWAPVVTYATQLQAAWWGWHAVQGRTLFPRLRLVFAAGAGLAPVHHERHTARGGQGGPVDRDVFVDTSSYGPQALDALVRALGIDALVLGSDAPYAEPIGELAGEAATRAVRVANPARALGRSPVGGEEVPSWPRAS